MGSGVFFFRTSQGGGFLGDSLVTLASIRAAQEVLAPVVHRTHLEFSETFSGMSGTRVFLKAENQQKTGSFKVRGAYSCVSRLTAEQRSAGVIASSAGNHGQGVAFAAQSLGVSATVVMPSAAPLAKQRATAGYGARVLLEGDNYDECYQAALRLQAKTGATFVHPFDDPDVISGQGTVGLEILEDLPDADAVLVPVGGGGLAAGLAVAVKNLSPRIRVIGVQAKAAPATALSLAAGRMTRHPVQPTLADGLAVQAPGRMTFPYLQRLLDDMVTVDEEAIASAIALFLERAKMLVEGAGAVGLAALLGGQLPLAGRKVVVLASGGNIDVSRVLPFSVAPERRADARTAPAGSRPLKAARRRISEQPAGS